ncbi:MAG TPA: phospholipid carrier-dependent glycosyltransferase [Anaerolineales bacterium]|nr:phospholipid carrier-dependent glycosyltransferase [Anaerolineales bacterium]
MTKTLTHTSARGVSKYSLYLILIFIALAFMLLLRASTPYGSGLINDSIAYVAGARSILAGTGYSEIWLASELEPITHYPPLFPLVLAFVGLFGVDPLAGARAVNILLFGANIILIGILGWKIFKNQFMSVLLALLFAVNGALFRIHSYALSEPAFLFFCLSSFLILQFYLAGNGSRILLFALGVIVGMAILDRYAGLALFGTIAFALFLLEPTWRSRIQAWMVFLGGSIPLPLAWLIYNTQLTGFAADRSLSWHPVTTDNLLLGVTNFSNWLIPLGQFEAQRRVIDLLGTLLLFIIGLGLLVWLVAGAIRMLRDSSGESQQNPIVYVAGAFTWIYILSVLASISLFDPTTKFQDRILVPAYLSLLIVLVAFIWWIWRLNGSAARIVAALVSLLILGLWSRDLYQVVSSLRQDGEGYASRRIRESSVIKFVNSLPSDIAIYTDSPPSIYSGTERPSFVVFVNMDNSSYLLSINKEIKAGHAILVLFDTQSYGDSVSNANYRRLTEGAMMIARFGRQRAFMGEE